MAGSGGEGPVAWRARDMRAAERRSRVFADRSRLESIPGVGVLFSAAQAIVQTAGAPARQAGHARRPDPGFDEQSGKRDTVHSYSIELQETLGKLDGRPITPVRTRRAARRHRA